MLEVEHLTIQSKNADKILSDVTLTISPGECAGLTGSSGSGKTTLIKAILGMQGEGLSVTSGRIILDGSDLSRKSAKERRQLCGKIFGFIPQNPMTAFFPHVRIGTQIEETFCRLTGVNRYTARILAANTLNQVNLDHVERIMSAYPGELSGGMLQRIAMALILGTKPKYILADEPTSALDEGNRNQLVELLRCYQERAGILFISHDAQAIKTLCPFTRVMEHGRIIETQPTEQLFISPIQPWTKRFIEAASKCEEVIWQWTALR